MAWKLSIDGAGRLVVPKPVRDQLRLRRGSELWLEVQGQTLQLTPAVEPESCLVQEDGVLYLGGELDGPLPTLEEVRRRRSLHVLGTP